MTVGWPASITATHEFVVPKSIPIIFPIANPPQLDLCAYDDVPTGIRQPLRRFPAAISTLPLSNLSALLSSFFEAECAIWQGRAKALKNNVGA
jgi:hypothetical protein